MIQIFNRNRGNPIDAVLPRPIRVQDEVHFLDRDLVGQGWQLIENLFGLWARLALQRLREKNQPDGPRHFGKHFAELLLISRRN
jgi:hypothetical protein